MILNREQFDNKWVDGNLSVVDWFDTTDSLFDKISEIDKELTYELQNNRELMCELSELKNRTCSSCKFLINPYKGFKQGCKKLDIIVNEKFFCGYYKRKDK